MGNFNSTTEFSRINTVKGLKSSSDKEPSEFQRQAETKLFGCLASIAEMSTPSGRASQADHGDRVVDCDNR